MNLPKEDAATLVARWTEGVLLKRDVFSTVERGKFRTDAAEKSKPLDEQETYNLNTTIRVEPDTDLAVVKIISDRIVVMYLGKICEVGPADTLYAEPLHPYTRAMLDSTLI